MPEGFTQVPPNSSGNMMRTRTRVVGANTVHEQSVFAGGLATFFALADAVAFAANKHHISIFNAVGSNQIVAVRKLIHVNLSLAAVTGVPVRFDVRRSTLQSLGTAITPVAADTGDPALANVTVATGATVTNGALLYPVTTQNDEIVAANTAVANYLMQATNLAFDGPDMKPLSLRPGEGMTVQQITSTTVGSFAWLMVFTVDPT
jgi:hypothetical protein